MMTTDLAGTRVPLKTLSVDAGMMAISTRSPAATRHQFPTEGDYDLICDHLYANKDKGFVDDNLAVSSSGVGDGGYDLVHVVGPDGAVRGIEVIFLHAKAIDDE